MYDATAASGYEQGFTRISSHVVPFLLRAGRISRGQRVLDVATGTRLAAGTAYPERAGAQAAVGCRSGGFIYDSRANVIKGYKPA